MATDDDDDDNDDVIMIMIMIMMMMMLTIAMMMLMMCLFTQDYAIFSLNKSYVSRFRTQHKHMHSARKVCALYEHGQFA